MPSPFDFDTVIDRRNTSSTKWEKFGPDVLPFWVADMDFAAPHFILDALRERLDHPILGYTDRPESLNHAFLGWLQHHYGWEIDPNWVVWVPGVVPALNLATHTLQPPSQLIVPTPVYYPFLDLESHSGLDTRYVPMRVTSQTGNKPPSRIDGGHWSMDYEALTKAAQDDAKMMLICNPQNPTGRCYTAHELDQLAQLVAAHDLILVSDEIHSNVLLDPTAQHIPIAHAHPEILNHTISVFAATKTYNIPAMSCAAAVIPDPELRQRFLDARAGIVPSIGPLALLASEVAFNDRSSYIPELLAYLRGNLEAVARVAGPRLAHLEATYLAWINVSDLALDDAEAYFAEQGIGIAPGSLYGVDGYIRFNFGCPKTTLEVGLERLAKALRP